MAAKPRSLKPGRSRRKTKQRSGDLILIVCEGERTEPIYFNALKQERKLSSVTVKHARGATAPRQVVERAIVLRDERARAARRGEDVPFDQVWCVVDGDGTGAVEAAHVLAEEDRKKCGKKKAGIQIADSMPCFELWLLLHFRYTTAPEDNSSGLEGALSSVIGRPYEKNAPPMEELLPRIEDAVQNAERLANHCEQSNTQNPHTAVHELVKVLLAEQR